MEFGFFTLIIGLLLLVIGILLSKKGYLTPKDPNCSQDVHDAKVTRISMWVLIILGSVVTISSVILVLL